MKKALTGLFFGILFAGVSACINITVDSVGDTVPAPAVRTEIAIPSAIPTATPPAGFWQYQLPGSGIGIFIPENWVVTGEINGEFAILQSYPEDKYIGGEARQPGDTKCDMRIKQPGANFDDLVLGVRSNPNSTIISEEKVILNSGERAIRFEINNLGRSLFIVADFEGEVVSLVCFGNLDRFDKIAFTLASIY